MILVFGRRAVRSKRARKRQNFTGLHQPGEISQHLPGKNQSAAPRWRRIHVRPQERREGTERGVEGCDPGRPRTSRRPNALKFHISRHRLRSIDHQGLTLASYRVARPPGHVFGPYTSKSEQLSAIFDERWKTRSAKYAFGAFRAFPGLGTARKGPEWIYKRARAIGWPNATRAQSLRDFARALLLRQALRTDARGFCS